MSRLRMFFADGVEVVAPSATALLARLGAVQAEPCDAERMKVVLSARATVWADVWVDPDQPDEDFVYAFGTLVPMVMVVVEPEEAPKKAPWSRA